MGMADSHQNTVRPESFPLDYLKLNNYLFYRDFLVDSLAQADQKTGKI